MNTLPDLYTTSSCSGTTASNLSLPEQPLRASYQLLKSLIYIFPVTERSSGKNILPVGFGSHGQLLLIMALFALQDASVSLPKRQLRLAPRERRVVSGSM